jgi:hypothetical protein
MAMALHVGNYQLLRGTDTGDTAEFSAQKLEHLLDTYDPESKWGYMVVVRM